MALAYTRASPTTAWVLVVVWTAIIVTLSLMPLDEAVRIQLRNWDLTLHAGFYAVLAVLTARALTTGGSEELPAVMVSLLGAFVLGGVLEWLQGSLGRSPDLIDWLSDCAGAVAVLVVRSAWTTVWERS